MSKLDRRTFFKRLVAASAAGGAIIATGNNRAEAAEGPKATVIDLTKCDGCIDRPIPKCVEACRINNASRFPNIQGNAPIPAYWPRTSYEDWTYKKHVIDRLTPFNWIYIAPVKVEGLQLYIPRRCMHCENPPCHRLCPFGAYGQYKDSSVVVKEDICFGGAKCRQDCPWGVPQRQAGVGLYLKIAPKFGGGGVMYKCDHCHDLINIGKQPDCVTACQKAQTFGDKAEMQKLALKRRDEINGHIYGLEENGGTSVFYVSPVPFAAIDRAMREQGIVDGKPGRSGMPPKIPNKLEELNGWARSLLVAPIATMFAAGYTAYKTLKKPGDN